MYDILQLNDMLLPELLDIAEQQKITGAKKLDKQGLIYKILDSQAIKASAVKEDPKKKGAPAAKPKKAVNVKTANITEEAEVMQEAPAEETPAVAPSRPIKKAIVKKGLLLQKERTKTLAQTIQKLQVKTNQTQPKKLHLL